MPNNKYKLRDNRCIQLGDTHSTSIIADLLKKVSNGRDVVHIGDCGLGFGLPSYASDNAKSWLDKLNVLCSKIDVMLYLIRGNHDAPWVWDFDNKSNLILLQDGDVLEFPNGKTALTFGGGISVDRYARKANYDYWFDEPTTDFEVPECDFVFCHDAPEHFNHPTHTLPNHYGWYVDRDVTLMNDCLKQRLFVSDICEKSGAKVIVGGHFHRHVVEEVGGVKYLCLDINEIWEFDSEKGL